MRLRPSFTFLQLNSDAPYHAEPIDVWGVGVILFTLLAGSMCKSSYQKRSHWFNNTPDTPWDEPTANSPEFCGYVNGSVFYEEPWSRIGELPLCALHLISCKDHRSMSFVSIALIRGLLCVNPAQRMTLDDAFQHPWCIRFVHSLLSDQTSQLTSYIPLDRVN